MHPAIFFLDFLAFLGVIAWLREYTTYVKNKTLQRELERNPPVPEPKEKPETEKKPSPEDPLGRLNLTWEELEEKFDLFRNMKSPKYTDENEALLTQTLDDNSKLKSFCRSQIQDIATLQKNHAATKYRLAWFEAWYPKLHSTYNDFVKNGCRPGEKVAQLRKYAKDGKKAYDRLNKQYKIIKQQGKRWQDQSNEYKFDAQEAEAKLKTKETALRTAEVEIRRLLKLQNEWKGEKKELENNIEKLVEQKLEMQLVLEEQASRAPASKSQSMADALRETESPLASPSPRTASSVDSPGKRKRNDGSTDANGRRKLYRTSRRDKKATEESEMEEESGVDSPYEFGFFG